MNKKLGIPFNILLQNRDLERQTYGHRANNPDICKNNSFSNICVYKCVYYVCKKSSRAWRNQYLKLQGDKQ